MLLRPPRPTRTATLFPDPRLFRSAPLVALLLVVGSPPAVAAPLAGLALLCASQFVLGLLGGPMDIALFTIRQRRTDPAWRSEEHTSELQSLMRISYAVFCLKKKRKII